MEISGDYKIVECPQNVDEIKYLQDLKKESVFAAIEKSADRVIPYALEFNSKQNYWQDSITIKNEGCAHMVKEFTLSGSKVPERYSLHIYAHVDNEKVLVSKYECGKYYRVTSTPPNPGDNLLGSEFTVTISVYEKTKFEGNWGFKYLVMFKSKQLLQGNCL